MRITLPQSGQRRSSANHFVLNWSFTAKTLLGVNYLRRAIARSRTNLDPSIDNALAKPIATPLHGLVQATQYEPSCGRITSIV
jgi:hypothetical protein